MNHNVFNNIESGTVTLHLDWFDPDNPVGSLVAPTTNGSGTRDNYGSMILSPTTLEFTAADNSEKYVLCTFEYDANTKKSAHAGDNYIVAAHPNEDVLEKYVFANTQQEQLSTSIKKAVAGRTLLYPESGGHFDGFETVHGNLQTPVLTVWRTLWVELDRMALLDPNPNGVPRPDEPNISLAESELAEACIDVQKVPEVWNPTTTAQSEEILGETTNPNFKKISIGDNGAGGCRDTKLEQVSNSFWLVHGIGAYKCAWTGTTGYASSNKDGGSFFIFEGAIRSWVSTFTPPPGKTFPGSTVNEKNDVQLVRTAYHEIMHYFGLNDVTRDIDVILNELAAMNDVDKTFEELKDLLATHEGRIYEFFRNNYDRYLNLANYPFPPPWKAGDGDPSQGIMDYITCAFGTPEQIKLKPHQIIQIQGIAKPRPYSKP